ncbi:MAG: hypothetical protein ABSC71_09030 [Candidatus Acidiferrales bacterium]
MNSATLRMSTAAALLLAISFAPAVRAQDKDADAASGTATAHVVVTAEAVRGDGAPGALTAKDVQLKSGKTSLKVSGLIPAQGDNAGLQLFIAIDDTCTTDLGVLLSDIRSFVQAQPKTTVVGVGYMSNAQTRIVQNFTDDKDAAAKAIRLPLGQLSSMDSPYLSLQDLIKRWPVSKLRREVIFITDGIDRLRNFGGGGGSFGGGGFGPGRSVNSFANMSPDVDSTSRAAQRSGVIVYSIYAQGVGSAGRSFWEATVGQSGISQISDETGGESFILGVQNVPSLQPYFNTIERMLNNQYFLIFQVTPLKKADLRPIKATTEISNTEIVSAKNALFPGTGDKQ